MPATSIAHLEQLADPTHAARLGALGLGWTEMDSAACAAALFRRRVGEPIDLVGLVGGASSGKSSLFNTLAGGEFSRISAHAHETRAPIVTVNRDRAAALRGWHAEAALFAPLALHAPTGEEPTTGLIGQVTLVEHEQAELHNIILIDTPDVTSRRSAEEGALAHRLLPWLDLLVLVVDEERWFDATVFTRTLALANRFGPVTYVVYNQTEPGDNLTAPARQRLLDQAAAYGLGGACISPFVPGSGYRPLAPDIRGTLLDWITTARGHDRGAALATEIRTRCTAVARENMRRTEQFTALNKAVLAALETIAGDAHLSLDLLTTEERNVLGAGHRFVPLYDWYRALRHRGQRPDVDFNKRTQQLAETLTHNQHLRLRHANDTVADLVQDSGYLPSNRDWRPDFDPPPLDAEQWAARVRGHLDAWQNEARAQARKSDLASLVVGAPLLVLDLLVLGGAGLTWSWAAVWIGGFIGGKGLGRLLQQSPAFTAYQTTVKAYQALLHERLTAEWAAARTRLPVRHLPASDPVLDALLHGSDAIVTPASDPSNRPSAAPDEHALAAVNERLARLLGVDPMPLATGGGASLADPLWVWGVVGGKDVGKSTLINALAGDAIVDRGIDAGPGTTHPAAYLCHEDAAELRARFAAAGPLPIDYHPVGPGTMRRLVLVDLPDIDSLFDDHVATVRRLAGSLDGIIWVTTPKKLGDLRARREVDRILKARSNFAYVVNKIDWLIAQSDEPPATAVDRTRAALHQHLADFAPDASAADCFLVAARAPDVPAFLDAVAALRGQPAQQNGNRQLADAARAAIENFTDLRRRLTTPPAATTMRDNKQANLRYQLRSQAGQILDGYQVRTILDRVNRALDPDDLAELVTEYFADGYQRVVLDRLIDRDRTVAEWSRRLFRSRVADWPLVGIVVWPVLTLVSALSSLRAYLPSGSARQPDAFRVDGVSLADRMTGLNAGIKSRFTGLLQRLNWPTNEPDDLAEQFRADAIALVERHRAVVFEQLNHRRASVIGRAGRGIITVGCCAWFPLVQPMLAAALAQANLGWQLDAGVLLAVVEALSGGKVLAGLCVDLLLLGCIGAAVYAGAVRAAGKCAAWLDRTGLDPPAEALRQALLAATCSGLSDRQDQLAGLLDRLEAWLAEPADAGSVSAVCPPDQGFPD